MSFSPSILFAARGPDFDVGQVIFVILFLLVGFIQWVIKLVKQRREAMERMSRPPPTQEEILARRTAWEEQVGGGIPEPEPPPAAPPPRNPLEELLEQFREMAGQEKMPPPPVEIEEAPPPPPPPALLGAPPRAALPPAMDLPPAPSIASRADRQRRHPLRARLEAIGGLQQAIVLREVLGPPKALQSEAVGAN